MSGVRPPTTIGVRPALTGGRDSVATSADRPMLVIVAWPYARRVRTPRRRQDDAPILRATALAGPGWVHATVARRTYRRRLGFAEYDMALSAEGSVLVLHSRWRLTGLRRAPPLVEILEEGWLRRPAQLHRQGDEPP